MRSSVHLIRHGETEWSLAGRHTGKTDLPLTAAGELEARNVGARLRETPFSHVFSSPRNRALRTATLSELLMTPVIDDDLREWDYGEFEGLRSSEILARQPQWNVFRDGCPGGESPEQVTERADRVVTLLRSLSGEIAVFSHGHFLRALAVRWVELPIATARRFYLSTGSISLLGYEHDRRDEPVVQGWNERPTSRA